MLGSPLASPRPVPGGGQPSRRGFEPRGLRWGLRFLHHLPPPRLHLAHQRSVISKKVPVEVW